MSFRSFPFVRWALGLLCAAIAVAAAPARAGASTPVGALSEARSFHSATLLPDGRVLIAGGGVPYGISNIGVATDTVELFDPATGTLQPTARMHEPRMGHGATLLEDGTVLVAGGYGGLPPAANSLLRTAEIYDPAAGTWTPTGSLNVARTSHTQT